MTTTLEKTLGTLLGEGLAAYGFACVDGLTHPRYAHLPYAISLLFVLSDTVVDEICAAEPTSPTYSYFHHYRTANTFLDQCALRVAAQIEKQGHHALPVAASQTVHDLGEPHRGIFPHKTAACRAGLGWIGKSALFISPVYGPRVRLATVLTDFSLPDARRETPASQCGHCTACVTACPAQAMTGASFSPALPRAALFDAEACNAYMRRHFMGIGRGSVCGICVAVCPFGKKATV